jgi:hypothetical protein
MSFLASISSSKFLSISGQEFFFIRGPNFTLSIGRNSEGTFLLDSYLIKLQHYFIMSIHSS